MRITLAVVLALLVGWFASAGVTTTAQTVPPPEPPPDCHFEIYGPEGSTAGWMAYSRVIEPVIMIDQCTGASWQFLWTEGSVAQWRPIGMAR